MVMIIIIALKGANRDFFLQSPHCAANSLQHERSSGYRAQSCVNHVQHVGRYYVQHVVFHVEGRDGSAIKFSFFFFFFFMKRRRRGGNPSTRRKPLKTCFRVTLVATFRTLSGFSRLECDRVVKT